MSKRVRLKNAIRAAVVVGALHAASPVLALGLGDMQLRSFLNEPLLANVTLLDLRGLTADDIRIRLGGADDFDRLGVERSYFLTAIQFEVVVDESTGSGAIRLTTAEPVLEPYLDLIIEARWPSGRLLREYTVLVDPPAFRQDVLTVSASEEVRKTEQPPASSSPASSGTPDNGGTGSSSTSGDALTMRGSNLAPGEMPERAFSAETAMQPKAGNRYMVKRDETLWQIASRGRPKNTSVQQAMLDIQRLNPEAFIQDNINRIKAGYIIYLPDAGDISSDDLASALDEVREQNLAFNSTRAAPGVTAAATLRVSADSADVTSDKTPARDSLAGTGGSSGNDPSGGDGNTGSSAGDVANQQSGSSESDGAVASAELAAQLNSMANRLDTLEQIVALKDEQIATLEQALREAREAAAVAPLPAPLPAPAVPSVPATPASPPIQAPASAAGPDAQSKGVSTPSFPLWPLIGGVLAILAMLAFLLIRRRRGALAGAQVAAGQDAQDDVFAGVSLKREALETAERDDVSIDVEPEPELADESAEYAQEDVPELASPAAPMGNRGYGERKHDDYIDEGSGGDALAEADIYIAYGRYLQAIELLNTAIEDEPDNNAYRLKLIELYVDMGEETEAREQLKRLRRSGDKDAIARAEDLVGGGLGSTGYAPPEPVVVAAAADEPETETTPEEKISLEKDLGLELEVTDLEDIDLKDLELTDTDELQTLSERDKESYYDDLSFEPVSDEDLLTHTQDLEFGDDKDPLPPIEFEGLQIDDDVAPQEGDGLDIVIDDVDELDLSEALEEAGGASVGDAADEEDLVFAEDADQIATKLDLARAYLDMGDGAGARTILEQVIGGGTGEQQQEARELLTRID